MDDGRTRDRGGGMVFIREFLRHPLQVASVMPSSGFLRRRVVAAAGIADARLVVELGPGTGCTTRALLDAMPAYGRLLCVEVNPSLHRVVSRIGDERLIAHHGSACELGDILQAYGLGAADAVVSGIPFSTMSRGMGARIVAAVSDALVRGGRFVAYQASGRVAELCRPVLGVPRMDTELFNIPPMRVFCWERVEA